MRRWEVRGGAVLVPGGSAMVGSVRVRRMKKVRWVSIVAVGGADGG